MYRHALPPVILSALTALSAGLPAAAADSDTVTRGQYLLQIGGCNDCHTPGYPESGGQLPPTEWLTGNPVGFLGPWGTSYPSNLRLLVQGLSEDEWLTRARAPMRPPMPWFNLRAMTDEDLLAIYRYIRVLGPAGSPMPLATGPEEPTRTAYIEFVSKEPHR